MNSTLPVLLGLVLGASAPFAIAHDPAEHAKEAAAKNAPPDCAEMKNMDRSKMDMNDPVMKAMMAKCGAAMDHSGMEGMDHSRMGTKPSSSATKPDAHGGH